MTATTAPPTTLTTADLAQRWRVSTGHIANLRSEGRGPVYLRPNGGRVVYRLDDVEAYEDGGRVQPVRR